MDNGNGAGPLIIDDCFDYAPLLHNVANRLKGQIGLLFYEPAVEIFFTNLTHKYGNSPAWDIADEPDFPVGLKEAQEMIIVFQKITDQAPRLSDTLEKALRAVHPRRFNDALEASAALWEDDNSRCLLIAAARIFFLILAADAREKSDLSDPDDEIYSDIPPVRVT